MSRAARQHRAVLAGHDSDRLLVIKGPSEELIGAG